MWTEGGGQLRRVLAGERNAVLQPAVLFLEQPGHGHGAGREAALRKGLKEDFPHGQPPWELHSFTGAPRALRLRSCAHSAASSQFFLHRDNTFQKLLSKPWCCPCRVVLFSCRRQSGHTRMSPRSTCPFELVLKIIPFQVKHIYLIILLLLLCKSFLRLNRRKKIKERKESIQISGGGSW